MIPTPPLENRRRSFASAASFCFLLWFFIALMLAADAVEAQTSVALVDQGDGCTQSDCADAPTGSATPGPNHGEITLDWTPAASGAASTWWEIGRTESGGSTFIARAIRNAAARTETISNLDVTKTYDIWIRGRTSIGITLGDKAMATDVPPLDTIPPSFSNALVNGTTLTITFDKNLDTGSAPAGSAFSVSATPQGGSARNISGTGTASLSGMTATVTLASTVAYGEMVTVSYAKPASNPLQNTTGTDVANFSAQPVTNFLSPPSPSFSNASVNGTTLTITFDRNLDTGSAPTGSAFSVSATPQGGSARNISGTGTASLSGMTATVTLASAVAHGETVTVSYAKPASNPLQNTAGSDTANFSGQAVTNTTPPPPSFSNASVNGVTLTITFDRNLDTGSAPAGSAFSVSATPQGGSARNISGTGTASLSGMTATVTLASAVAHGETVTVSYAKPASNPLQNTAGSDTANFSGQAVTNTTPPPPSFSNASVNGVTLTITFDRNLDTGSAPAGSAFSVSATPQGGPARNISGTGTASLSGMTATVTLASAVAHGETVTASYAKPSSSPLQSTTGADVANFSGQPLTNITPLPPPPPPPPPEEPEEEDVCAPTGAPDNRSLSRFVECAAERIENSDTFGDTLHLLDGFREGEWNDGSTYLVLLTERGGVYFHADHRETEDRNWSGVLSCEGGGDILETEVGEGCSINSGGAYAHKFSASHVPLAHDQDFVLVGGFDETPEGEPFTGMIGEPSTQAGDVDTDDELRGFVAEAKRALGEAFEDEIDPAELRGILRAEGPWREGDVYVYMMDETGRVIFDGEDRDREQKDGQYVEDLIAEADEGIVEYTQGGSSRRGYAVRVEIPLDEEESRVYIVGSGYRVEDEEVRSEDEEVRPEGGGGGCSVGGSGGAFVLFPAALLLFSAVLLKRDSAQDRTR